MYEPQEDSFMLMKAVEDYLKKKNLKICADIGTGTGIQGIAMAPYCQEVICSDINIDAVNFVQEKVSNKDNITVLESDLFKSYDEKYKGKLDLIAFNPPYLPKESDEADDIELTGGESGLEVTEQFIIGSREFLSDIGKLFFVVSSLSDVEYLNKLLEREGFSFKIVDKKHFFFEDILIYEAQLNERHTK